MVLEAPAHDPICRATPTLGPAIEHALATHREALADGCDGFRQMLRRGVERARAQDLNLEAAARFVSHRCGEEVEQQWDLLTEDPLPLSAATQVPIQRGVLPRGTTGFDPVPATTTLTVVAKVAGALAGSGWKVQLREGKLDAGMTLGEVAFSATDADYVLRSAPLGYVGESGFQGWPQDRL